jgi:hypothetical protein
MKQMDRSQAIDGIFEKIDSKADVMFVLVCFMKFVWEMAIRIFKDLGTRYSRETCVYSIM